MHIPLHEALSYHLPADAVDHVAKLLTSHQVNLHISRHRVTKLGDFKPAANGYPHRLSVNGNLNRYEFLLVFLHEFAHMKVYEQLGRKCRPHGAEWKAVYGDLIRSFIRKGCFDPLLTEPLTEYSYRVKASGVADITVAAALRQFDDRPGSATKWMFLAEVPDQAAFTMRNGRRFVKTKKIRTRYRCRCLDTKRYYLVHGEARVFPVEQSGDAAGSGQHAGHE